MLDLRGAECLAWTVHMMSDGRTDKMAYQACTDCGEADHSEFVCPCECHPPLMSQAIKDALADAETRGDDQ